jgi:hypothetical protein
VWNAINHPAMVLGEKGFGNEKIFMGHDDPSADCRGMRRQL